jgi:hypothetical protein
MVTVGMGQNGPGYRLPGVNVKIAGLAVKTSFGWG